MRRLHLRILAAFVIAVLAAVGLVSISGDDAHVSVTIPVDGPDRDLKPDESLPLSESALDARADVAQSDAGQHDGENVEAVAGLTFEQEAARREASEKAAEATTSGPDEYSEPLTLAQQTQPGCVTRFVGNRSGRNGARPALIVLHYTVSPNRPGRSDVDGITAYFNSPRSQASSHYVIDAEGNCNYIVPETLKAWTQGFLNPWSIAIEQINTGREGRYAGPAGLAKLGLVVSDIAKRWGIPLRRGSAPGCGVSRSGIVDHNQLGCRNDHTDINPYSVEQVIAAAIRTRSGSNPPSPAAERQCRKLNRLRKVKRGPGQAALAQKLKANLKQHRYRCLRSGVRRA